MTKTILVLISFAGGLAVGLLIADAYAKGKVTGDINSALGAVGLGGGRLQNAADQLVPTLVG